MIIALIPNNLTELVIVVVLAVTTPFGRKTFLAFGCPELRAGSNTRM
jgi:hypothetical protein